MADTDNLHDHIIEFLRRSRELNRFCTQNGWIDDDSVEYEIIDGASRQPLIGVRFTEIVMEGSGCVADRVACYGRLRLELGGDGRVERAAVA